MTFLRNKRFTMAVQGCRTNLYEADAIAGALEARGAVRAESDIDIAVVVTCTITSAADSKCRKIIRKLRREHPNAVIVAAGCYVQKLDSEFLKELGVDIAIDNRQKHRAAELLDEWFAKGVCSSSAHGGDIMHDGSWDMLELDRPRLHTRAFMKVQDGCAHFCSYCIVPLVRGKPVSRDMDDAVAEAKSIAASGCPEIILTGVHLGLYKELGSLVAAIAEIDGIKRIRFGSIEPMAISDELLARLADVPQFCRHLHIPLQSGDAGVLEKMRRGYTPDDFMKLIENVRARLGEETHISTDLMIGFCGEDDKAFENSMEFIKAAKFGKMHIFPYSPREDTIAASWPRPSPSVVKEREKTALSISSELHREYCERFIGLKVEILAEEFKNGSVVGLAKQYVRIAAKAPAGAKVSDLIDVVPARYEREMLRDNGDFENNFSQDDIF